MPPCAGIGIVGAIVTVGLMVMRMARSGQQGRLAVGGMYTSGGTGWGDEVNCRYGV